MSEDPQPSPSDQRRMNRFVERMARRGRPLATIGDGKIAQDAAGRAYVRPASIGGNVRIVLTDDGPMRVVKMNKADRKAAKRARMKGKR